MYLRTRSSTFRSRWDVLRVGGEGIVVVVSSSRVKVMVLCWRSEEDDEVDC